MNQTLKENQEWIVTYQNNRLLTNITIKYLHFHVRFYIENVSTNFSLSIDFSFKKSIKSKVEDSSIVLRNSKKWHEKQAMKEHKTSIQDSRRERLLFNFTR